MDRVISPFSRIHRMLILSHSLTHYPPLFTSILIGRVYHTSHTPCLEGITIIRIECLPLSLGAYPSQLSDPSLQESECRVWIESLCHSLSSDRHTREEERGEREEGRGRERIEDRGKRKEEEEERGEGWTSLVGE